MSILANEPWVERLGLTLLHSLWQGAIIAAVYAALRAARARALSPRGRYFFASTALAAMAVLPVATWLALRVSTPESAAASFTAPLSAPRGAPPLSISLSLRVDLAPHPSARFLPWVVLLWLTGTTAFSLRLVGGWILAQRLRSRRSRPAPAQWQRALHRLKARMSVSAPVRLVVSGVLHAPAAAGWLRPVLLVPAGALAGVPAAQMEALLLHELAHIRRHDYLIEILQNVLEAVLFYHPAVWWISGHMRAERELCCDDLVVAVTGDAVLYARALAEFDAARSARSPAIAANGGSLACRIARLLGQTPAPRSASCVPLAAIACLLLTAGAWTVFAQTALRPAFEVVSIKPSSATTIQNVRPQPGGLIADASPKILVQYAYGVQGYQIVGGPDFIQSARYRIDAKANGNPRRDQVFAMLQTLLEDRFQLQIHHETKDLPVYALEVARGGLKLPPPRAGACDDSATETTGEWAGGRMAVPGETPAASARCGTAALSLVPSGAQLTGGKIAMPELVRLLSLILGHRVIDRTGFTGVFDLRLEFLSDEITESMPPPPPDSGMSGPSIVQALRDQLGLQLQPARGPVDIIVIDHAERPTAN
jgi:uncharacterized protein (TIGR03435 family)